MLAAAGRAAPAARLAGHGTRRGSSARVALGQRSRARGARRGRRARRRLAARRRRAPRAAGLGGGARGRSCRGAAAPATPARRRGPPRAPRPGPRPGDAAARRTAAASRTPAAARGGPAPRARRRRPAPPPRRRPLAAPAPPAAAPRHPAARRPAAAEFDASSAGARTRAAAPRLLALMSASWSSIQSPGSRAVTIALRPSRRRARSSGRHRQRGVDRVGQLLDVERVDREGELAELLVRAGVLARGSRRPSRSLTSGPSLATRFMPSNIALTSSTS